MGDEDLGFGPRPSRPTAFREERLASTFFGTVGAKRGEPISASKGMRVTTFGGAGDGGCEAATGGAATGAATTGGDGPNDAGGVVGWGNCGS